MPDFTTETRAFADHAAARFDRSWRDLIVGQRYHLTYERFGDRVYIAQIHGVTEAGGTVMSAEQFEQWWVEPQAAGGEESAV